jgi:2-C-methyl-D-erythritol 2,4-cyclodiphosphate synthase
MLSERCPAGTGYFLDGASGEIAAQPDQAGMLSEQKSRAMIRRMKGTQFRIGLGHDTHRLVPNRPLVLGGVAIAFDRGLLGHSDADILLHAVTDALLGAAGLGDIGEAFPDTDAAYAGIDSAVLLSRALERVAAAGWRIVNLDCTVFAQRPKLAPHKPVIRRRLAELLGLAVEAINVKAKTGEQVGPIGREEAMSADAVVLLERVQD